MKKPIRIYTPHMDLLHETDDYLSLQFKPKFYDIGGFELHINQYIEGAEYFQKNNLIMLDKRPDKVMIIKHREIILDESGKASENWKITGYTLDGILNQRVTIPPANTDYDRKSGDAETVMKHYIERHFINPDDPKRKIPHIEVAPNKHRGQHIEWESRYKNVADEIVAIAKQANLGWAIYADIVRKKWIFDVIEPRDLTQGNEAGNPPVFFSPDFSTIKTQTFVDSESNFKNIAIVGGEGEGSERKIVTVGDSEGLERLEVFIDARDIQSTQTDEDGNEVTIPEEEVIRQLIERGKQKLETDYSKNFYLEAQILTPSINERTNRFSMETPFEYEKDFRLGDLVQVFNKKWNITMDAPITEFNEIHEAGGFVLEATFGEAAPTLITKIKREFDELKDVELQELPVKVAAEQMKEATKYTDEKLSEEEQERIRQAQENLEAAKKHTENWAEQGATVGAPIGTPVGNSVAEDVEQSAKEGKQAKEKIDNEVGEKTIETTDGALIKAEQAEQRVKGYTDSIKQQLDAELAKKASQQAVEAVQGTVSDLQDTANSLQQAVSDHADELAAQEGRITTVETDVDELDGKISTTITELSTLQDTVSQQQTQISANTNAIALKADQSELDTVKGDVSSLSGELNVLAGKVELKAERSEVEALEGDVSRVSNDLAQLTVDVDGISSEVSSVRADLDGLEIGGRNYLPNSKAERQFTSHGLFLPLDEENKHELAGEQVVVSFEARHDNNSSSVTPHVYYRASDGYHMGYSYGENKRTTTEYQRFVIPIDEDKIPSDMTDYVYLVIRKNDNSNTIYIRNVKLEKGNKATDWTPAPEDVQAEITAVEQYASSIDQKADSISATVSSLQTTVGEHGTQISQAQTDIQAIAGQVSTKAEASEVTELGTKVTTVEQNLSALEGVVETKVDDGEARSIFLQEASSFTFSADQINFDGHVFGENATFSGTIQGAEIYGSYFESIGYHPNGVPDEIMRLSNGELSFEKRRAEDTIAIGIGTYKANEIKYASDHGEDPTFYIDSLITEFTGDIYPMEDIVMRGMYRISATNDTLYLDDNPIGTRNQEVLWTGAAYPTGGYEIFPTKRLSECVNGWVLVWSDYDPDTSTANNYQFALSYIPKTFPRDFAGMSTLFTVPLDSSGTIGTKTLYISDNKIVGHNDNHNSLNRDAVLRRIYEY